MESKLAAISQLDIFYGGYHIYKPDLNYYIALSKEAEDFIKQPYLMCDMVWSDKKIIVEYDSNLTHLDKKQHYLDKRRTTALNLSGYSVISITSWNLANFRNIDNTFFMIRKALGMRRFEKKFADSLEKRYQVVKELFFNNNP